MRLPGEWQDEGGVAEECQTPLCVKVQGQIADWPPTAVLKPVHTAGRGVGLSPSHSEIGD